MRALVTGSAGFLARHFVNRLMHDGFEVVGCDPEHPRGDHWRGDCRALFQTETTSFDLVVHCAATIPAVDKQLENGLSVATDLALDAELFQYALRTRPHKIVYFSSAAAYPFDIDRPVHESDIDLDYIVQPDRLYGITKLVGEIQAREANRAGLDVLVVRPQSGYGPGQSLNYPFPSFIERAKRHDDPFEVWGSGNQERDFVHVSDIVGATMAFLEADFQGPVNIGTGVGVELGDLARVICDYAGYCPEFRFRSDKPECAPYHRADTTLMNLYYKAQVSLEEGIAEALA